MKGCFLALILSVSTLLSPFPLSSDTPQAIKDRMKGDLDFIRNTLDIHYAPILWKQRHLGWDLDREIAAIKSKIDEAKEISVKDYQILVKEFFRSIKDYHVSVQFFSTESAVLPFTIKGVEGRYFISYIDKKKLSPKFYPIDVGDEVVMFDDQPIQTAFDQIVREEFRGEINDTDRTLAERLLTKRLGLLGQKVPHGAIMIGVLKEGSGDVRNYQIAWDYTPEQITHHYLQGDEELYTSKTSVLDSAFCQKEFVTPYCDLLSDTSQAASLNPYDIGSRKGFLPKLGLKLWESAKDSTFHAYTFNTQAGHHVGYIRIPSYRGEDEEVQEFAECIKFFEKRTDALVIDQLNNPGGSVFYMYALVSMLTDQPLFNPAACMTITQKDVATAAKLIPLLEKVSDDAEAQEILNSSWSGYPISYQTSQFVLSFLRFIKNEWNQGKTLTDPCCLYGVDKILPHPETRYTKPILVLTNECAFSCGDIFPAILQDNKRATIMGSKTAGAGGFVRTANFPNLFGIKEFRYTGSLLQRLDKTPIENLGVTPDIPYVITEEDLRHHYIDYIQAIHDVLEELIAHHPE